MHKRAMMLDTRAAHKAENAKSPSVHLYDDYMQDTPWLGRQAITGLTHREIEQLSTLISRPTSNLESPINLTCMSLGCRKRTKSSGKDKGEARRLHVGRGLESRTFLL